MTGLRGAEARISTLPWYRALLANINDTISLTDADGKLLFSSGAAKGLLGYPEDHWSGLHPLSMVHPDEAVHATRAWDKILANPGVEVSGEVRMAAANGTWQDIFVTGVNLLHDPDIGGIVLTTRNVTPLRRAERLASHQAAVLEHIARGESLNSVASACVQLLEDNGVRGQSSIYLLEDQHLELRAGDAPASIADWVRQPMRHRDRSVCDLALATRSAVVVPDLAEAALPPALVAAASAEGVRGAWSQPILSTSGSSPVGTLSVLYDDPYEPSDHERRVVDVTCSLMSIALEREENERRLAHQALHDGLTGLPNRTLLLDRLNHVLARRGDRSPQLALLFCDIDRFKVINDSLGHDVGDQVLVALSDRFRSVLSPADTVARFGGDEFVILVEDVEDRDEPIRLADRLAASLEEPFVLTAGTEVYLTVSIGLAHGMDHRSGEAWLRDADAAMYRAKDQGRNRMALFDTAMRDAAVERLQVESDLRRAVERDELVVHFQPLIDLHTGRIAGAEALLRWRHPTRGLVLPRDFISVAEDIGSIGPLGDHAMDLAVGSIASMASTRDLDDFVLSVNISARQFAAGELDAMVGASLERHDWPASSLLLEINETGLMQGITGRDDVMAGLQDLGVALAIDDFGTGFSSLARLGHVAADQVKIHQSFVAAIDRGEPRMIRIVDAVIAIAGALDLKTTAEGVETQAQLDYLRRTRCDYGQGYLFSRPLPIDEFTALLDADPRW